MIPFINSLHFARNLDLSDPLNDFRKKFYFPVFNGKDAIYFNGNSLGLQPKTTQDYILKELEDWATFGVEGHFHAPSITVARESLCKSIILNISSSRNKYSPSRGFNVTIASSGSKP